MGESADLASHLRSANIVQLVESGDWAAVLQLVKSGSHSPSPFTFESLPRQWWESRLLVYLSADIKKGAALPSDLVLAIVLHDHFGPGFAGTICFLFFSFKKKICSLSVSEPFLSSILSSKQIPGNFVQLVKTKRFFSRFNTSFRLPHSFRTSTLHGCRRL